MAKEENRKILIIGAGLGGLAAAYYFAHNSYNVTLFEKHPSFSPRGGTMSVRPNATRSLSNWGLHDAFADHVAAWRFRDLRSGEEVARHVNEEFSGYADWGVDRGTTQGVLFQAAEAAGAVLEFGREVVGVGDDGDRAWVDLGAGERVEGSLVVVADGIASRLRRDVIGVEVRPVFANATNYPVELDGEAITTSGLRQDLANSTDGVVWVGQGKYAIGRYAPKLDKAWLVFDIRGEPAAEQDRELWAESGNLNHIRTSFSGCCASLKSALSSANRCDRWNLAHLPELPHWRSPNGRLILLGDSAHAMLPNVAQGFSTIIEDIDALGTFLAEHTIAASTEAWEKLRMPRVSKIQAYAAAAFQGFSGGAEAGENGLPDYESSEFLRWLLDYDVGEEARGQCFLEG
ncbi:hypothetical protein PRZ48_007659 [Zasmidium cellare]|uniref:FAD-binding domain-containing protein n=1 Tax=Zasmidium cellare TaxID=395010 RepID=A0ABR0EKR4_ZASCE|nr:hypothetical protein PRZ48_007659 [Zasmidium cellare]